MAVERFISYIAVLTKTDDSKYFVDFPDLPGCFTQGDSIEEAICMAQDALAIYYTEKKGELPAASSFELIQRANADSLIQIIAIDTTKCIVKPIQSIKKTLTIPKWLNELAEKYQVNFSKVLKNALISYLRNMDSISTYDLKMLND